MRVLSLLAAIRLASTCGVSAVSMISDPTSLSDLAVADQQIKRALRQQSDGGERGGAVEKLDDAFTKLSHSKPLNTWSTSGLAKVGDVAMKFDSIAHKYPNSLSSSTMKQLLQLEEQRAKDVALLEKMNKEKPDSMQRVIEHFPGMKVAPVMTSHTRGEQLYTKDKSRLIACIVVSRSAEQGGGDVLLISSSDPNKMEWLLPKGGWDKGEDVFTAARREALEEGGVGGEIVASLGNLKFTNKDNEGRVYHALR